MGRKTLWVAGVALWCVLCFCMLSSRVEGASAMSRHVAAARVQDEGGKGGGQEQKHTQMVGGMFLSSMTLPKALFQRCFESAEHSITAAIYKFGDKDLYESLLGAIERSPGLKVRIVANEKTISKKHRGWLAKLEEEGSDVEVRLWKKHGDHFNKLHAKFTVCDNITVSGSPNWSGSSNEGDNMEIVEVSTDRETAQKMENLFGMLWTDKHANRL